MQWPLQRVYKFKRCNIFFFAYIICIVIHMISKFTKCNPKVTKNHETKSNQLQIVKESPF